MFLFKCSRIPILISLISSFSSCTSSSLKLKILKSNYRLISIHDYASTSLSFSSVADIGCDHGLLSLALYYNDNDINDINDIKNNNFKNIYAIDVSEAALNDGIVRKKQYIDNKFTNTNNLKNLHIIQGNGLNALQSNNIKECDVIISAGIGCNTLHDIFLNNNSNNLLNDLNVKQIIINPWPPSFIRQHLLHCSLIKMGYIPERQKAVSHYNGSDSICTSRDINNTKKNNNNSNNSNRRKQKMSVITSFYRQKHKNDTEKDGLDVNSLETFELSWPAASENVNDDLSNISNNSNVNDLDMWTQYANKELITIENNINRRIQSKYYNDDLLLAARDFLRKQV